MEKELKEQAVTQRLRVAVQHQRLALRGVHITHSPPALLLCTSVSNVHATPRLVAVYEGI